MPILHRGLAPKFRLRFFCLLRLFENRALHHLYPSPVGSCIGPLKASLLRSGRVPVSLFQRAHFPLSLHGF
jgi:hypothetical protein